LEFEKRGLEEKRCLPGPEVWVEEKGLVELEFE